MVSVLEGELSELYKKGKEKHKYWCWKLNLICGQSLAALIATFGFPSLQPLAL
jgi:hypothetical protein